MSLIEGIGDEVTLVFGLLVILVVGLLAWFSTHTSDIPFFSVIVVELSQRARNRNRSPVTENNSTSNQDEHTENANEDPPVTNNRRSLTDVVSSALDNVNDALSLDRGILEEDDGSESDEEDDDSDNDDGEEHVINTETETSTTSNSQVSQQTVTESSFLSEANAGQSEDASVTVTENELRQRRVAFFDNSKNQDIQSTIPVQDKNPEVPSVSQQETFISTDNSEIIESTPGSDQSETSSSENQIRVRLKYLNDTQRLVLARPLDTIGYFKRTHFPEELAQQKLVRLIFNGQDLRNETSTLQSCNVVDNSVLHCLVTQNVQTQQTIHTNHDDDINIGNFMIPIFGLILGALWYLRFNYKQYFNATSTLSLAGISFLFVFATFTVLRPHNPQHGNRHLE